MNIHSAYEASFAIFQPTRTKMLKELNKEPLTITELSKKVKVDRTTITYHFGILGELVKEEDYEILKEPSESEKGKAGRRYSINQEALDISIKEINKKMQEFLPKLKRS